MNHRELITATAPSLFPDVAAVNPRREDPTERVIETIKATPGYNETIIEEGDLSLITGPAVKTNHPHPQEKSDYVLWVGKRGKDQDFSLPWGDDHNVSLAKNHQFWSKTEAWVDQQRETNPALRFFLLLGNPHPDHPEKNDIYYDTGMQSIPSLHAHLTNALEKESIGQDKIQTFDPNNKEHLLLLSTFLTTGDESIENFKTEFKPFRNKLQSFPQLFEMGDKEYTLERPFLAFQSLAEGYSAAVAVQRAVKDRWLAHAIELGNDSTALALGAWQLYHRQSVVPNMTLISLSAQDQQILGVGEKIKAAVFPFSLGNPQSILDGVLLDRQSK